MVKLDTNNEIKKVEQRLEKAIRSKDSVLEQASLHLLSSGGEGVRPAFIILSSQFGKDEQTSEQTYQVVVALELIHMVTLVHDDVIDKSGKRRDKLTMSRKWDQITAILTGNSLLALGLEHSMAVKDNRIYQLISESVVDVCRGELFQFQDQFDSQQTIINCLRRINRKAVLLVRLSTEVGAITSQSDKEIVRKLKMIGHYIGMSLQIIDDALDFTSTEKKLGKPVGSDLLNGHIMLPILLEMRKNPDFESKVEQLRRDSERKEFEECTQITGKSDSIDEAKEVSSKYLSKALNLISELPDGHSKSLLSSLTKKMESRDT